MVGHAPHSPGSRARLEGYQTALETAGLTVAPELIRHGAIPPGSLDHELHALLSLDNPPTAVFASSDLQAVGIVQAAHRRGLRVPEDLSIVGVDDTHLARAASPSLTTIRRPFLKMGALAARTALDMSRGDTPRHQRVELATELVCRASSSPPHL